MPDYPLPTLILISVSAVIYLLLLFRFLKNRLAPVKTVKAQVVDKNKVTFFSKTGKNGKSTRYAVVFMVEGKKLSFYVSEFSYGGYRKGETGTLKYKGDRIIDFS